MDAKLNDLERRRMERRTHRTLEPDTEEGTSQDKLSAFDIGWHAVCPSGHLPFHGNPLDRSGTQAWGEKCLSVIIKTSKLTQFLPVNGRSVFGLKQSDTRTQLQVQFLPSNAASGRADIIRASGKHCNHVCRAFQCFGSTQTTSPGSRIGFFPKPARIC